MPCKPDFKNRTPEEKRRMKRTIAAIIAFADFLLLPVCWWDGRCLNSSTIRRSSVIGWIRMEFGDGCPLLA